jgi:TolB-like protein
MRHLRSDSVALLLCASALGACASGMTGPEVKPEELPALEAQAKERPGDAQLFTRLGIGYYNARNWTRARDALRTAASLDKADYPAIVYLGLTYEELGAYDSARAEYGAARPLASSNARRSELDNRLTLLTRREMMAAAQAAIAQEATLSQTPPAPNTVAVIPFRYAGSDTTLAPLGRGLTQLVVNDLARVTRLTLLERERVQALVDEMKLTSSGRVDPATGARSGRLLRADQVVQGTLQDAAANTLRLDANVVSTTSAQVTASGSATDPLQQVFDAEKTVVLQLLGRMGITLTPAEQAAIRQKPTENLQAFLAFSRGLVAEDNGDFSAAARFFNDASARDPGFQAARAQGAKNAQMSQAQTTQPQQLASNGGSGPSGGLLQLSNGVNPSVGGGVSGQGGGSGGSNPPDNRPPVPESGGGDNVVGGQLGGTIIIVIPRP